MKLWTHTHAAKTLLSLAVLLLSCYAQAITTTTSTTVSTCYNTGTLTLTSTGGTAPYTYTITSGPVVPGITYPYSLPSGQNSFSNLTAGSYSGTVRDASGATGAFGATVGGTYTFPTMLIDTPFQVSTPDPALRCHVTGGLPPYQFALSTTGANSGFGPYQSDSVFRHICPGTYWVRVRDACGNIFTDSRHFNYVTAITVQCANYSQGIANVAAQGGNAPYSYTFTNTNTGLSYTNQTGIFPNVGPYSILSVTATDSCGVMVQKGEGQRVQRFVPACGPSGLLYGHVDYGDTLTMICTNCVPAQTVTRAGSASGPYLDTIFRNAPSSPHIVVVTALSACGRDTLPAVLIAPVVAFMQLSTPACNKIQAQVYSGTGGTAPVVDSFVLSPGPGIPAIQRNTTGLFANVPDGNYTVIAYLHPGECPDSLTIPINMPVMGIGCYQQMKDSSCSDRWLLSVNPVTPEAYFIVNAAGDTVRAKSLPGYFDRFFYHLLPAASYTIMSTGGCAKTVTTPRMIPQASTIGYVAPCTGPPVITYTYPSDNFCTTNLKLRVWRGSTMVVDTEYNHFYQDNHISVSVPDSGLYTYKYYIIPMVYTASLSYDSICPIDSGTLHIISDHRPRLQPAFINVCDTNGTDSIFFHVAGGFAPYTVQIPGYDTLMLTGERGPFPTHRPGTYAMVVYDNCGVSRSLSLTVVDSCHGCPTAAMEVTDTLVCVGDSIGLTDLSIGGVANEWQIDEQSYSTRPYVTYAPDSGLHQIVLISGAISGCLDTAIMYVRALLPVSIDIGTDTVYCDAFSRTISTGVASTVWSTGDTATQIIIQSPGTYTATVTSGCGVQRDSITLLSHAIHGLQLTADSTTLCSNVADSLHLYTSIDSQSARPVTVTWSTGQQATPVYSADIWAYTAGTYQVIARDGQCSATTSITILPIICDTVCVGCDTTIHCNPCDTTCPSCPDTTCANCPDTSCISRLALPNVFSPNGDGRNDSFYVPHTCTYYSFSLRIYDRWGQMVYESKDINKAWDGTYRGKPQPTDTYSCFICSQARPPDPIQCREWAVSLIR